MTIFRCLQEGRKPRQTTVRKIRSRVLCNDAYQGRDSMPHKHSPAALTNQGDSLTLSIGPGWRKLARRIPQQMRHISPSSIWSSGPWPLSKVTWFTVSVEYQIHFIQWLDIPVHALNYRHKILCFCVGPWKSSVVQIQVEFIRACWVILRWDLIFLHL